MNEMPRGYRMPTASFVSAAGQIVLSVFGTGLSTGRVVSEAGTERMMHDTAPSLPVLPAATSPDFLSTLSARPLRSRLRASIRGRMVVIWVACCQSLLRTSCTWREACQWLVGTPGSKTSLTKRRGHKTREPGKQGPLRNVRWLSYKHRGR